MSAKRRIRKNQLWRLLLQGVGLVVVLVGAYWLARVAHDSDVVQEVVAMYGYVGVFLVSFVGGFNVVVPVPVTVFVPVFVEAGLSFWLSIFVLTAGMTVADGVSYVFGFLGRTAYVAAQGNGTTLRRLEAIRQRHRYGPLLALLAFAAFAPLPNEVLIIPMGVLGYRLSRILPIVFVGNLLFNTLYAMGVIRLFELI